VFGFLRGTPGKKGESLMEATLRSGVRTCKLIPKDHGPWFGTDRVQPFDLFDQKCRLSFMLKYLS
jgi:hypothetical protein